MPVKQWSYLTREAPIVRPATDPDGSFWGKPRPVLLVSGLKEVQLIIGSHLFGVAGKYAGYAQQHVRLRDYWIPGSGVELFTGRWSWAGWLEHMPQLLQFLGLPADFNEEHRLETLFSKNSAWRLNWPPQTASDNTV